MEERPQFVGPVAESEWGRFLLRHQDGSTEALRDLAVREAREHWGVDVKASDVVLTNFTDHVLEVRVPCRLTSLYDRLFCTVKVPHA